MLEIGWFGLLAFSVVMGILCLYVLIFKECAVQRENHYQRLSDMKDLVQKEIDRSQKLSNQVSKLTQIKEKTQEQLDLINPKFRSIEEDDQKNSCN